MGKVRRLITFFEFSLSVVSFLFSQKKNRKQDRKSRILQLIASSHRSNRRKRVREREGGREKERERIARVSGSLAQSRACAASVESSARVPQYHIPSRGGKRVNTALPGRAGSLIVGSRPRASFPEAVRGSARAAAVRPAIYRLAGRTLSAMPVSRAVGNVGMASRRAPPCP